MNFLVALAFLASSLAPLAQPHKGDFVEPVRRAAQPLAILYVNGTSGFDGNSCLSPAAACRTIGMALQRANHDDTINIAAGVYPESNLEVGKRLTLQGAGSGITIIDGQSAARIMRVDYNSTLSDLTLRNGAVVTVTGNPYLDGGGALLVGNAVTVTLRNSMLVSNSVNGLGGAILTLGKLILEDTQILSNTAVGGGGVHIIGTADWMSATRTTFGGNVSTGSNGGAIETYRPITLTDTVIRDNRAGTIGGGMYIFGSASLNRVTLYGNRSEAAAAVFLAMGAMTLTNVTLSENTAGNNYGGIWIGDDNATTYIRNSTISHNRRTNLAGTGFNGIIGGKVRVANSIIAHNDGRNCADTPAPVVSEGHNLSNDFSCNFTQPGDITGTNAQLGPLANNGGATPTRALLGGSPALDNGDNASCESVDQRQIARPYDGDGNGTATCDIGAFEARQRVSIGDVAVLEGTGMGNAAVFTVTLIPTATSAVAVDYATINGDATAGSDFTTAYGTLIFNIGESFKTISVPIAGDGDDEANESFTVALSNFTVGDIIDASGTGTIIDDDGLPSLTISDHSMLEGNRGTQTALFTVTLSPASAQAVTVNFASADASAVSGSDYDSRAGALTFNPGQTSRTISVTVRGDIIDEGAAEDFIMLLSNASNATVTDGSGAVTIVDDDTATLSMTGEVRAREGDIGTAPLVFSVTLSTPASFTVTVDYLTNSGFNGAIENVDFVDTSGTLIFAPGETLKTVTVQLIGDRLAEPDEILYLELRNGSVTLIANINNGVILDDDSGQTQSHTVMMPMVSR